MIMVYANIYTQYISLDYSRANSNVYYAVVYGNYRWFQFQLSFHQEILMGKERDLTCLFYLHIK